MLIDKLGMPVAAQKNAEIIKPGDDTLQFYAVDQEDCKRHLVFTDKIEKCVLEILWPPDPIFKILLCSGAVPGAYCSLKDFWCRSAAVAS